MLNSTINPFLILGQVPGTSVQITFSDLMLIFDLAVLFMTLEHYHHVIEKTRYYWLYSHLLVSVTRSRILSFWQDGLSVKV
jgi:hypothetical protein